MCRDAVGPRYNSRYHLIFSPFSEKEAAVSNNLFSHLQCTDIVGVAYGKLEATELVRVIMEDIYRKTGGLDVRNYFKDQDFGEY